ncbi:MAG: aldo/keto reductase [Planctomycetes bacterium]|nr:aldo/keto reductase [Planctomycetota bacterium]
MRKVPLGSSGLQAGVLAVSLSAPPTAALPLHRLALLAPDSEDPALNGDDETLVAVRGALAAGADFIDTDWITANGHAQEVVGRLLQGVDRPRLCIGSKGGPRLDFRGALKLDNSRGNLINQLQDSLFRLKTGHVELFQVHWPDATDPAQTARGLADLRHMGLCRALGLCNHDAARAAAIHALAPLATVSAPLNLLRPVPQDLIDWCAGANITFLAADPLCGGILGGRFAGDESFAETDDPLFNQPAFGRACAFARELRDFAAARGLAAQAVAGAWCLQRAGVGVVLCDAREFGAAQSAPEVSLPDADWRAIEAMAKSARA